MPPKRSERASRAATRAPFDAVAPLAGRPRLSVEALAGIVLRPSRDRGRQRRNGSYGGRGHRPLLRSERMSTDPVRHLSPENYLTVERQAEKKHEYVGGETYAMAGASARHNLIVAHLVTELDVQMRGRPCRVYPSDLRVAISADGPFFYPDVVALCEQPRFLDDEGDTLLNPEVIVEVLSSSTEAFDRGLKFSHYRTILLLREVLFVAQDAVRVEHFVRQADGQWLLSDHSTLDARVELPAVACHLDLARVYDKVELNPTGPAAAR